MAGANTIELVKRAKSGDRGARDDLLARYYERWVDRFHGELGTTLRAVDSTHDLVQSALVDAMRDIGGLRNEGAFFAWVTMIIKRKIAQKRRRVRSRPRRGGGALELDERQDPAARPPESVLGPIEDYDRVTEVMLRLFPDYPRPMAAVALRYLWGKRIEDVMDQLGGVSRRSAWLWIRQGLDLLRDRLDDEQ